MTIRLFERIRRLKLRIPGRRKAANPLPVLAWQQLDQDDQAELLEGVKEDAARDVIALQDAMRGPN